MKLVIAAGIVSNEFFLVATMSLEESISALNPLMVAPLARRITAIVQDDGVSLASDFLFSFDLYLLSGMLRKAGKLGAIEALLSALKLHVNDAQVARSCVEALVSICWDGSFFAFSAPVYYSTFNFKFKCLLCFIIKILLYLSNF